MASGIKAGIERGGFPNLKTLRGDERFSAESIEQVGA